MINLTEIPKDEQANMISSFWTMLQECEHVAIANEDPVLKLWVDNWYVQWNRVTGDNKKATWE